MTPPAETVRREIAEHGVLSFARFMELALYCPNSGYYETKKDNPGRRGDFYTSVSAGELFGQLLAFRFCEWLEALPRAEGGVWIVEAGAHDGRLASDILTWLQARRPKLFAQIEYGIVEPSRRRQAWQQETLKDFASRVRWFNNLPALCPPTSDAGRSTPKVHGVIFSNELLDAMPVHRFGWDAGRRRWFEWGVALAGDQFVWARSSAFEEPPSSIRQLLRRQSGAETAPASLLEVLPDGYTIETCPAAENWWRQAAVVLGRGKLLTIDYGLTGDELFSPARPRSTLRAYFRHHATDDVLARPGEQDLTAHVDFSAIQSAGEACGLKSETFSTQAQFLTHIAEKIFRNPESFGEWGAAQNRQFQTLTHPEHLGQAFRVIVQSTTGAAGRPNS
jgi:SAM-dependent MidA family methyltransferase